MQEIQMLLLEDVKLYSRRFKQSLMVINLSFTERLGLSTSPYYLLDFGGYNLVHPSTASKDKVEIHQ